MHFTDLISGDQVETAIHQHSSGEIAKVQWSSWQIWQLHAEYLCTLQGTSISPTKALLKMIFLFPRWDKLVA